MNNRTLATKSADHRTADPKKEYRIQGWGQVLSFQVKDSFKKYTCNCGASYDYWFELREHRDNTLLIESEHGKH